jgi:hypothetical protein
MIPLALVSILVYAVMAVVGIGLKISTLPMVALGAGIGVDYGIYLFSRMQGYLRKGVPVQENSPLDHNHDLLAVKHMVENVWIFDAIETRTGRREAIALAAEPAAREARGRAVRRVEHHAQATQRTEVGQHVIDVDLNTFIKLFVNHRPVYGIGKNNIQDAFAALMNAADGRGPALNRDDLLRLLREEGEYMGQQEMEESLNLLVGDSNFKTALPQEIQADDFAENILGFEEVEEVEGEEGADEMGASAGFNGTNGAGQGGMSGGFGAMGVIPEEAH